METRVQKLLGEETQERTRKYLRGLCDQILTRIRESETVPVTTPEFATGPDLSELTYPMTVPGYLPDLLMLADAMRRVRCRAFRDALMERCEVPEGIDPTVCVWGWDDDAVDNVLQQFFEVSGHQGPTAQPMLQFVENDRFEHLARIHERVLQSPREEGFFLRDIERLSPPMILFVVIDIDQPGATQNQITQSKLRHLTVRSTGLIAVIQSLRLARINGPDEFAEAFDETLDKTLVRLGKLGLPPNGILANDQCLDLSFFVDRLFRYGHELRTQADEVAWGEALGIDQWPDRSAADLAFGMMRSWRARHNNNRPAGER